MLAAATFAAIPFYRAGHHPGSCVAVPGGRVCSIYYPLGFVYWPIALVLAYVAIASFYIRRSRVRGLGTRVRPYVIAGIVLAIGVTVAAMWALHHPLVAERPLLGLPGLPFRLATPAFAIGLGLLVLAWAERNRALLALTLGYLVVVLVPVSFGWVINHRDWFFLPQLVIEGSCQ